MRPLQGRRQAPTPAAAGQGACRGREPGQRDGRGRHPQPRPWARAEEADRALDHEQPLGAAGGARRADPDEVETDLDLLAGAGVPVNEVNYPPTGMAIALQFWDGDKEEALRLARLIADIEPVRRTQRRLRRTGRAEHGPHR